MFQELFLNNWNSLKEGVTPLAYGRISFCFKFQYVSLVSVEKKIFYLIFGCFHLIPGNHHYKSVPAENSTQIFSCGQFRLEISLTPIFIWKKRLVFHLIFDLFQIMPENSFNRKFFIEIPSSEWKVSSTENPLMKNFSREKFPHGEYLLRKIPPRRIAPTENFPMENFPRGNSLPPTKKSFRQF